MSLQEEEGKTRHLLSEISATHLVLPKLTNFVSSTAFIITIVSSSKIAKQKLETKARDTVQKPQA